MIAQHGVFRGGVTLALIAAICTAIVAATYLVTKDRIVANQKAWLERGLQPVLAGISFDSGLTDSRLIVSPPHQLPGSDEAVIYRVYDAGKPAAALFVVSARGYSGPIRLLVGVDADGIVTGVRVIEHRETHSRDQDREADHHRKMQRPGVVVRNPVPAKCISCPGNGFRRHETRTVG